MLDKAEQLSSRMELLSQSLSTFVTHFTEGFPSLNGADGSPVDLSSLECLDPLRFSAFLALLPSCSDDCAKCEVDAQDILNEGRVLLIRLVQPGIASYRREFDASITNLQEKIISAKSARNDIAYRVSLLLNIRRIWATLDDISKGGDSLWSDLVDGLMKARWK